MILVISQEVVISHQQTCCFNLSFHVQSKPSRKQPCGSRVGMQAVDALNLSYYTLAPKPIPRVLVSFINLASISGMSVGKNFMSG